MGDNEKLRKAALVTGVVFLAVGVLGFIPGVTSNYDDLTFNSHHSQAELLGIFQVSVLHNIVHLLFGVLGIAAARTSALRSYQYLLYGGIVYFALFVYGLVIDKNSSANFVPVNSADDVLHVVLAIVMVGSALALRDRHAASPNTGLR
jgi:hypothetical protein